MKSRILGIAGSMRRLGNTEILLMKMLQGAADEGAIVELLNLYDYKLDPCRGCLNCILYKKCPVNDDFEKLMNLLGTYDGIIAGSPNYANSTTAVFKLLSDRIYLVYAKYYTQFQNIRAAVFVDYFYNEFIQTLPLSLLAFIFAAMKFQVIETGLFQGTSVPGGVVKSEHELGAAYILGRNFARKVHNKAGKPENCINVCPDCYANFFHFREDNTVQCPVCSRTGRVENGKAVFRDEYNTLSYLSPNWLEYHLKEVLASLDYDRIKNTSSLRNKYKDMISRITNDGGSIP